MRTGLLALGAAATLAATALPTEASSANDAKKRMDSIVDALSMKFTNAMTARLGKDIVDAMQADGTAKTGKADRIKAIVGRVVSNRMMDETKLNIELMKLIDSGAGLEDKVSGETIKLNQVQIDAFVALYKAEVGKRTAKGLPRPEMEKDCQALKSGADAETTTPCNKLVCKKDEYVACLANNLAYKVCPEKMPLINREQSRKILASQIGTKSLLDEMLDNAPLLDELMTGGSFNFAPIQQKWVNYQFLSGLWKSIVPVAMIPIVIIWWFLCCWSWWCCCRCCRCCSKERGPPSKLTRFFLLIVYLLLAGSIIVAASVGAVGRNRITSGMDLTVCSGATLVSVALNGHPQVAWAGLNNTLGDMQKIIDSFESGSPLMNDISSSLDTNDVRTVQKGIAKLQNTFGMGSKTANTHKTQACTSPGDFCDAMTAIETAFTEAGPVLESSVGSALNSLAGMLNNNAALTGMSTTLKNAVHPLKIQKTHFSKQLGNLFAKNLEGFLKPAKQGLDGGVYAIVAIMCPVALLGFFAVCLCLFKTSNESARAQGVNPYSPWAGRWAACGWCCAFLIALIAFLVGTLVGVVGFLLSHICVGLSNMHGDRLTTLLDVLQGGKTEDSTKQLLNDMTNLCIFQHVEGSPVYKADAPAPLLAVMKMKACKKVGNTRPTTCADADKEDIAMDEGIMSMLSGSLDAALNAIPPSVTNLPKLGTDDETGQLWPLREAVTTVATYISSSGKPVDPKCFKAVEPGYICGAPQTESSTSLKSCYKDRDGDNKIFISGAVEDTGFDCIADEYWKVIGKLIDVDADSVDVAAVNIGDTALNTIKTAFQKHITTPVGQIIAGFDCKFLGIAFQGLLDGLCFSFAAGSVVTGAAWTGLGFVCFLFMVMLYFVWRFARDNINNWEKTNKTGGV